MKLRNKLIGAALAAGAIAGCGQGQLGAPQASRADVADLQLTTTLEAELGNNTAASDGFTDRYQPATRFGGNGVAQNGDASTSSIHRADMKRGAVSKLSVHTLLPQGSPLRVFVETQSWFCTQRHVPLASAAPDDQCGDHIDIGYDANSTAQAAAQVDDMVSRGIDGAIVDWQGKAAGLGILDAPARSSEAINTGALRAMLAESDRRGATFKLAAMEDEGIRACASAPGCDVTTALIDDLNFLADQRFFSAPAYLTDGSGRPYVFFFDVDGTAARHGKSLDWNRIRSGVRGNPIFIFENGNGFTHAESSGAFNWVGVPAHQNGSLDERLGEVTWFDDQAARHPGEHGFGTAYKGFDDAVVNGWGGGRRSISQQCGKTWLDTFARAGSASGLEAVEVMTWDDYEEGTEIETGIDNHLALAAAVGPGTTLSWSVALEPGAPAECDAAIASGWALQSTVHHFAVYASPAGDGKNLALVADDLPASSRSLDLSGKLAAGDYLLFVKAVGQASITNHLSAPVAVRVGAPATAARVRIVSPSPGSTARGAVHVQASATAAVAIDQLQVWDNGTKAFEHRGSAMDTDVSLAPGAHTLTVIALDTSYRVIARSTVGYTVAAPSPCAGSPFFCDDFTDPTMASAYADLGGTWTRSAGRLDVVQSAAWQRALSVVGPDFADFDVTVHGSADGDSGLGLAYNVSATGSAYDAVVLHPAQFQGLFLKHVDPQTGDSNLASYPLPQPLAGRPVVLRVKRVGAQVSVFLDGTQVLAASDGQVGAHGQLGLLESTTDVTANAGARFTLLRIDTAP